MTVVRRRDVKRNTTSVRPKGAWIASASRESKLHRYQYVDATWGEARTQFSGRALCGWLIYNARLFIEPPDDFDICEDCLFAFEPVVYRFFDIDDALVYVGYTAFLTARLDDHRRSSSWWPLVYRASVTHYPDEESARAAEDVAIRTEGPLRNHLPGPKRRLARSLVEAPATSPT